MIEAETRHLEAIRDLLEEIAREVVQHTGCAEAEATAEAIRRADFYLGLFRTEQERLELGEGVLRDGTDNWPDG
ncbi:MAG: hypothetical protein ACF8R7_04210 [Phycisphaerales bacterium JB039]